MTVPGRARERTNLPNSFSSSHLNLGRVLSHGIMPTQSPPPPSHSHSTSFSASTTNLAAAGPSQGSSRPGFFRSAGTHFTNRVRKMSASAQGSSPSPATPPAISPPPQNNRSRPRAAAAARSPPPGSREGSNPSHGSNELPASRTGTALESVPSPAPPAQAVSPARASSPDAQAGGDQPVHRIRLVPHISSGRSIVFDAIERDVREGTAPIKFGRFTDRSGGSDDRGAPGARGGAIPNVNGGRGRIDQNRVAFKSKVVSRSHAELWCEGGGRFYIRDTKSSSGTFLNHVRLSGPGVESIPFAIKDGDVVQLGVDYQSGSEESYRCVKMRVELNRGWQRRANEFNTNALRQLRTLQGEPVAEQPKASHNGTSAPASNPAIKPAAVTDCCICLFSVTVCQSLFIAPCSHVFHYKCIRPLLQKHHPAFSCPLCRTYADLEADVEEEGETAELEAALAASAGVGPVAATPAPTPAPAPAPASAPAVTAPAVAAPATTAEAAASSAAITADGSAPTPVPPPVSVVEASSPDPDFGAAMPSHPQVEQGHSTTSHGRNASFAPTIAPTGEAPLFAADAWGSMSPQDVQRYRALGSEDVEMMDTDGSPRQNRRKRPSTGEGTGTQPSNQGESSQSTEPPRSAGAGGPFPVQFALPNDEDLQPAILSTGPTWHRTNPFSFGFDEGDADTTRAVPMNVGRSQGSNPFASQSQLNDAPPVLGLDEAAFHPMSPSFAGSLGASLGQTPRNDVLFAPSAERARTGNTAPHE